MDNPSDIFSLCRLCLVKDQVNISIFDEQGDIRQIFLKISSCLPIKVSRDDKLPKKICDDCSNKLDLLYEFWNSSANAEKTLLSWLGQAGVKDAGGTINAVAQQIAKPTETLVKLESGVVEGNSVLISPCVNNVDNESFNELPKEESEAAPPPPKRTRRSAAVKAQINIIPESEDDDDIDTTDLPTKLEDGPEDSDAEDKDPSYTEVPGTSANDQPGPSGVGKAGGVEAPLLAVLKQEEYEPEEFPKKSKRLKNRRLANQLQEWTSPKEEQRLNRKTKIQRRVRIKREKHDIPLKLAKNQKANMWTCKFCFDTFNSRKEMFEHRKQHTEEEQNAAESQKYYFDETHEIYICNNCSAECLDLDEIEKHIETHEKKFTCYVCKEDQYGAINYSVHVQKHRDDKMFPCPLCQYMSQKKEAMQVHINRLHLQIYDFQCRKCGKCFNDALSFKEHDNVHLNVKPFGCVVCSKYFYYSRYLLSHQLRTHTVRVFDPESKTQCNICQKIFARIDTLEKHYTNKHLNVRTGPYEKKHLCDVCGQGFSRPDKLKIHYRKHTGEKPYSCVYCSKSFIKRDYLIMHERIHSGEKPYSCEICGKCFNQGAPLRIHLRSHTGERPYICPYCGSGSVSRGALNSHLKSCMGTAQILGLP